jgi:hypothetical protein
MQRNDMERHARSDSAIQTGSLKQDPVFGSGQLPKFFERHLQSLLLPPSHITCNSRVSTETKPDVKMTLLPLV